MKSLSKITLFAALTAVTATACQKEDSSIDTSSGKLVKMTFTAGNPEFKPEVRTEIDGLTPYWSVGDQIGISTDGTKSNYPFTNDATERNNDFFREREHFIKDLRLLSIHGQRNRQSRR